MNPYFEGNSICNTILDDRLISHTLQNWIFGADYDGDILKESNIRSLIAYCGTLGDVNLVTADGSIDCLDQPESQEEFVSKLHMAEFIVGLAILANHGTMLIKMFTFFESSSVSMLFILSCCFHELHIFKPATSKEGNSEVYVIAIGYKKGTISNGIIDTMIGHFTDDSKSLLPLDSIPADFIQQVVDAARFFMNQQVAVIEGNIRTFKRYDKLENDRIRAMKNKMVDEYVRLYKVESIREDQKILHGLQVNNDINLNVRVHSGSHSERLIFFHLNRCDQYQVFFDRLRQFYDSIYDAALNTSCMPQRLNNRAMDPKDFIKLTHGRPIDKVVSSKFLLVSLMRYLIELRTFLDDSNEAYKGKQITTVGNHFAIEMEYFKNAPYDAYEKNVATKLLSFFLETESEVYNVDGLPLFTQFVVGLVLYLSLFVFEEVHLKRSSGIITFKSMVKEGKENLKSLHETLSNNRTTSKALLGICDTKLLFSLSQDFYKSVVDYNNHVCLKFCSGFLNLSNNL